MGYTGVCIGHWRRLVLLSSLLAVWAWLGQAQGAPLAFQEGLPPALVIRVEGRETGPFPPAKLKQQLEQLQRLTANATANQPRRGFLSRLFAGSRGARPVSVEELAAYGAAARGQRVSVEGLYQAREKGEGELRTDQAMCIVAPAEGTQPEGFPKGVGLVGMPVLIEGTVEARSNIPVVRADTIRPSVGVGLLRQARIHELLGNYEQAINTYLEAERALVAPTDTLRAHARISAGRIAYDDLRDKAKASQYYNAAWTSYVTNHAPGLSPLSVWMPETESKRWRRMTVAEAIGDTLDSLNSENFWYRFVALFVAICGGNAALGVLLLALVVRILIWPLTKKQLQSAEAMKRLQPQIKELQERFKDDKQRFQQEFWKLCQANGVNPLGGCLPLLVQMPILIMVYKGIQLYIVEFSRASFLWVPNLGGPDLSLLIAYTISMIVFQKMTMKTSPQVAMDPQQEQQQKMMMYLMPLLFFFMFRTFPAAFILYWLGTNIVYFIQQWNYMRLVARSSDTAGSGKGSSFVNAVTRLLSGEPSDPAADSTPDKQAGSPSTHQATEQGTAKSGGRKKGRGKSRG